MDQNFASSVNVLFDGTLDTFVVCAGPGVVVAQKTVAQVKTMLSLSGVNTGDQDLSTYLTISSAASTYQPLDSDLTTIAGLTATTDNFMQSKAGAWASRTIAQVKTDLGLSGTNTGDQSLSGLVPYTGATGAVNLGLNTLTTTGSVATGALTASSTITSSGGNIIATVGGIRSGTAVGLNWTVGNTVAVASAGGYRWSSTSDQAGTADLAFNKNAAGVVEINNGTAGQYRDLILRNIVQASASTIGVIVKGAASRTVALLNLQTSAGASLGNVGGTIFNSFTDTSSTSTDGTENDLYSYTTVANTLAIDGDTIEQKEHVQFVSSATASRRLRKYFAGTLIFDSTALTLTLGGDFWLETTVIRESSTVVRVSVNVVTTSASTIPYATYTRITGLTLASTNILKTTGTAAGAGAASGDIVNKFSKVLAMPAA